MSNPPPVPVMSPLLVKDQGAAHHSRATAELGKVVMGDDKEFKKERQEQDEESGFIADDESGDGDKEDTSLFDEVPQQKGKRTRPKGLKKSEKPGKVDSTNSAASGPATLTAASSQSSGQRTMTTPDSATSLTQTKDDKRKIFAEVGVEKYPIDVLDYDSSSDSSHRMGGSL